MTETDQPESAESCPEIAARPTENSAVTRCIRARSRALHKALDSGASDYRARMAGKEAFLHALPLLAGFDNALDFIACVTYAAVTQLISVDETQQFLAAAKVALGALRQQPRAAGALAIRGPGRPRQSLPAEENN